MNRSLWMGAAILVAMSLVGIMRRARRSRAERIFRFGNRMLRNFRFAGMLNISPRFMTGAGMRMLRKAFR
ncbi:MULTISPECIES: hypothetical protein [Aneurinibacillus]|uniref:Uncharacterized protein n=1 Tax=Aneurinibacillus thermoaerophilus TaxID=143495 RepID=A0A1G7YBZ4_ANETH|nr:MULTISPECIES: hypothetical protein [Aneurinibacillus]AMA72178.1 hypothetical protein ACH33_04455 [Aneurinibacillus sp. XH2]MED0676463.1 hypothetical protein [Aneurinibacillus thermoaerophilus]MED0678975.1 hypothetical protein [Aneurinibacillus thermoaerophilus]MED0736512.1 hypothetical protein [Aneurinibacillus thermoaerophilus]MED0756015.1 hypothetical protein [Aneurinibacillus thermoaerophilus]